MYTRPSQTLHQRQSSCSAIAAPSSWVWGDRTARNPFPIRSEHRDAPDEDVAISMFGLCSGRSFPADEVGRWALALVGGLHWTALVIPERSTKASPSRPSGRRADACRWAR